MLENMNGRNFRALESALPACFVAGILLFGWGLSDDSGAALTGRVAVIFLAIPFVAIVPLFGSRVFRVSLLTVGVGLVILFTVLSGELSLTGVKNTAIGAGLIVAGVSLTPRTQWIVSVLRWLLAGLVLASWVGGIFFAADSFASGGVVLTLPITIPLFLALLHRNRRCFSAPRDEWYRAAST